VGTQSLRTHRVSGVAEKEESMGLKALVVEDDADIRSMLEFSLQLEGYEVFTAVDGLAALDVLALEEIDVLLLDVMMPGMNGYEVVEKIRGEITHRTVPVIMITAKVGDEDVWEGWRLGVDSYITKPLDFDLLLTEMTRVTEPVENAA
jgi:DNA-binding response OmpR family regulator